MLQFSSFFENHKSGLFASKTGPVKWRLSAGNQLPSQQVTSPLKISHPQRKVLSQPLSILGAILVVGSVLFILLGPKLVVVVWGLKKGVVEAITGAPCERRFLLEIIVFSFHVNLWGILIWKAGLLILSLRAKNSLSPHPCYSFQPCSMLRDQFRITAPFGYRWVTGWQGDDVHAKPTPQRGRGTAWHLKPMWVFFFRCWKGESFLRGRPATEEILGENLESMVRNEWDIFLYAFGWVIKNY